MKKSNVLASKYPSYIKIKDRLNKIAQKEISSAITQTYKISNQEQEITTLLNNIINKDPGNIVCHEKVFPNIMLDKRFKESSDIFAATRGIWGYLGSAKIYCYNSNFLYNESRIFIYDKKRRLNAVVKVLEGE